jgi:hypothetical protein
MAVDPLSVALGAAACLATGALAASRLRGGNAAERLPHLLLPLLLFLAAVAAWSAFRLVPHWNWSAARLAASVRLLDGLPLYRGPGDPAVNGWIYGPVAAAAYLPAALLREPLAALRAAAWLNALWFLLPLFLLTWTRLRRRGSRADSLLLAAAGVAALLAPFGTWYGAAALGADTVAVAFGAAAACALARSRDPAWAAALAVLAAGTKQIEACLLLAHAIWLVRAGDRARLRRYLGAYALFAGFFAVGSILKFGFAPLWHCLITIPGAHPVDGSRIGPLLGAFAAGTGWAWLVLLVFRRPPSADHAASAHPDCALSVLLAWSALAVLPLGLMAAAKIGGDQNSLHALTYAILAGLARLGAALTDPHRRRTAALLLVCGGLAAAGFAVQRAFRESHLAILVPGAQHREAFAFAQTHPGAVAFPNNPLIILLAEGRDDPFDYGLYDWRLAGRPADRAAVRACFPPGLAFLVYHEQDPARELRHVFTDFTRVYQSGPWDFFTRPAPGATTVPAPGR